eukprot:456214-Pelagomonas_calceolata.AAC.3
MHSYPGEILFCRAWPLLFTFSNPPVRVASKLGLMGECVSAQREAGASVNQKPIPCTAAPAQPFVLGRVLHTCSGRKYTGEVVLKKIGLQLDGTPKEGQPKLISSLSK